MKKVAKYLIGALLLVTIMGSAAVAYAAQGTDILNHRGGPGGPDRGPHVGGEVIAVDGYTIQVENPRGEATIITNDETKFIVNGEEGSLADIKVGKFAGAGGEMQDDGSILADIVMVSDEKPERGGPGGPDGPDKGPHVGGEVIAVDGNTIQVENPRGEATIITNGETKFIVNGEEGSLADVEVGKFAGAGGEMQDDGSILAKVVMVHDEKPERPEDGQGRPGGPGKGPRIGGEVIAVNGNTIQVENPRGEATIITNGETKFIVNGEEGSLADVEVGKFAGAGGEKQDDGTILAKVVMVFDEKPERPPHSGGPGQRPGQGFENQ